MKAVLAFAFAVLLWCVASVAQATNPADIDAVVDNLSPSGFKEWVAKADGGDFSAPIIVGRAAQHGKGTKRDFPLALRYFRKALAFGSPLAAYYLAGMYDFGNSVPKDHKQAFKLYLQAANAGIPVAADSIGILYAQGRGVERDMVQALKWHRIAAYKGLALAQGNVGYFYQHGLGGVKQDYAEALKWYRLGAEGGDDQSQYNLGLAYLRGTGVPRNLREAEKWLMKAAEQDMPDAQNDLAVVYSVGGDGLQQDVVAAYKWHLIAVENGIHRGDEAFELFKKQMTPDQLAAAKREARDWMKSH